MRIIAAALTDEDLDTFAATYFSDAKPLTVVWDEGPREAQTCEAGSLSFTVTDASALPRGETDRRVVIYKLFYDEDAAYVELALHPTGKRGDFFLRKLGAWKVAQHAFREVKPVRERLDEFKARPEGDTD